MSMIGGSGLGKTNVLFNLIKEQHSDGLIGKIYLYAKDLNESKYQFLIKKREDVEIKHLNDSKAFMEYSQCMDDQRIRSPNSKIKKKMTTKGSALREIKIWDLILGTVCL